MANVGATPNLYFDEKGERGIAPVIRVKRIFLIAAWAIWLWLGFGLYRELPRDLGPVVCKFPFGENHEVIGFVGREPLLLVNEMLEPDLDHVLLLWDARTGGLVRRMTFPKGGDGGIERYSPSREFVVTERTVGQNDGKETRLTSLEMRTGEWADLPADERYQFAFHEEKPWAAFWNFGAKDDDPGAVFVVDLCTNKAIWRWKSKRPGESIRELSETPMFVGEQLVIPSRLPFRDEENFDASPAVEIWSIPNGAEPDRVVEGVAVGNGPAASSTGRIAWHIYSDWPTSTDVFDLNTGKYVFSNPSRESRQEKINASGGWTGPWISRDGRVVYGTMRRMLWDVDTSRELWSEREGATLNGWDDHGRVEIKEEWSLPYGRKSVLTTFAMRDALSGRLLHRSWRPTIRGRNRDEAMIYDDDSRSICELPLRVNWPLLAICQAILAAPLVLAWAVLRLKRPRA